MDSQKGKQQGQWLHWLQPPEGSQKQDPPSFQLQNLLPQSSPSGYIVGTFLCSNHQNWLFQHPAALLGVDALECEPRCDGFSSLGPFCDKTSPCSLLFPLPVNQMPGSTQSSSVPQISSRRLDSSSFISKKCQSADPKKAGPTPSLSKTPVLSRRPDPGSRSLRR